MKLFVGTEEGLAVFEGQEEDWRPSRLRLRGHSVTTIHASSNTLWVGTTNGIWRSSDCGGTWSPVRTGLTQCHVRAVAAHPEWARLVFIGTEPASVLTSRDGGESWAEAPDVNRLRDEFNWTLPQSSLAGCIRAFAISARRVYAAVEIGGVIYSDDGGSSWNLVKGEIHSAVHSLAAHPANSNLIYAATGGGRFRSQDGGLSWKLIGDGYTRAIWADPERFETLLAGPARYEGAMGRVERSIDAGETWALASDGFRLPMRDMIESFAYAGAHVLAVTSDGELYVSKRGVWIWHQLSLGLPPVHVVACIDLESEPEILL